MSLASIGKATGFWQVAPAHSLVAESREAVLSTTIGATMRVLERKECPSFPVGAVVFANGSPLALCQIRPPSPLRRAGRDLFEPSAFRSVEERVRPLGRTTSPVSGELEIQTSWLAIVRLRIAVALYFEERRGLSAI